MATKNAFGVQTIKKGGIDAVTGLPTSLTAVGDPVKGTVIMEESEGQITNHFSELKRYPVISIMEAGEASFRFQLMDTRADTLVQYLGGTVTPGAGAPDVWNAPTDHPDIEASFEMVSEDGTTFTINRAKVMGRLVANFQNTGITVIDVRAVVMQPLIDGVPAITLEDNFDS